MSWPDRSLSGSVGHEITRVVRRWQQLPLDHALSHAPQVRAVVQSLADQVAEATGLPQQQVPDHGPAVLIDQLRVMVYDHCVAGLDQDDLLATLTQLRRDLP